MRARSAGAIPAPNYEFLTAAASRRMKYPTNSPMKCAPGHVPTALLPDIDSLMKVGGEATALVSASCPNRRIGRICLESSSSVWYDSPVHVTSERQPARLMLPPSYESVPFDRGSDNDHRPSQQQDRCRHEGAGGMNLITGTAVAGRSLIEEAATWQSDSVRER